MGSISKFQYQQMVERLESAKSREPQPPPDAATDEVQELHYPIIAWCKQHLVEVPYIRARSDRESTIGKGAPDFTIFYQGRVYLFECKSRTGKTTPEQLAWHLKAERQGFQVHVIQSFGQFLDIITSPCHTSSSPS